jgi:hypothetical protein
MLMPVRMTLRSGYFEDWKGGPTVLFWGDAAGIRELRDFLRSACGAPNALTLDRLCEAVDRRAITVRAASDPRDTGMRFARGGLEWRLHRGLAEEYAEKIHVLASSSSGHQYLDAPGGQIAVEVSIGEYSETIRPDR